MKTDQQVFAWVREAYSALREAEAQEEKTSKREADAVRIAATARAAAALKRVEVGRALQAAHKLLKVKQGDRSGRWAKFLEKEGIPEENARRWMAEAGSHDGTTSPKQSKLGEVSERAKPQLSLVPAPREPLQILADMQLLLGRWEDVLSTDEIGMVDTLITDAPFSERTHSGGREGKRADEYSDDGLAPSYKHWTPADVDAFVAAWTNRVRGWMVALCDHHLIPAWSDAFERHDRYVFAPVPCVITGMTVRLSNDGPSSWAVYAMVARPRTMKNWNTLPGAYVGGRVEGAGGGRGKPRWLMDALVHDYSRPGDLVCDPLAGYGTTLVSALLQRRRAIGAEVDEAAVKEAFERVKTINEPEQQQETSAA